MTLFWLIIGLVGLFALRANIVINTGLVTKGARSEFLNRLNATTTHYQDLSTRIMSTTAAENYRWLGTVPTMREWGAGRQAKGLRKESYDVANLKYEATLEVDLDELRDDQTGQIRIRVAELAQRAATHKDYLIGQLLINGATTGFNSYDGVTFFNAAHVSGASGSQSNILTPAATDADVPTTAEFLAAFRSAVGRILGYLDDQGEPMVLDMSGLVAVVPPSMFVTATEALNATVISQTSNVLAGAARVLSFPWLSNGARWYLLKTDGVVRPFIFQDREPITFDALAETSEQAFKTEKLLYGVRARYRMTYGYWQNALQLTFTE